jgi:voltage-gated potassium channel
MGSDYWPQTPEGRLLCLLLAIYAFAVFGYVTAAIAAYFVDRDKSERLV